MTKGTKSAEDQRVGGHLPPRRREVGGLVERAFIGMVLAWMPAVSAAMLRRHKTR